MPMLGVIVSEEDRNIIKDFAEKKRLSLSSLMRFCVFDFIERHANGGEREERGGLLNLSPHLPSPP